MAEILDFPGKDDEDRIWVCDCGCTTFHVHESGLVECCSCEAEGPDGAWKLGEEVQTTSPPFTATNMPGDGFLFRRFAEEVLKENVLAAALFRDDGSQRTVYRDDAAAEGEADRRWWRRRARGMLQDVGADWKRGRP